MRQIQIIVGIGILVSHDGKVLITKRYDPSHPAAHLKWQLPGGKVEFDETIQEAVIREMQEEVSVTVTIPNYPPIVGSSLWKHPTIHVQCMLIGYICRADGQTVKISCEETCDFAWISPSEIAHRDRLPQALEFVMHAEGYIRMLRSFKNREKLKN